MTWTLSLAARPPIELVGTAIAEVSGWELGAGGESPTLTVTLDAAGVPGSLRDLLDPPPLRAPAVLIEHGAPVFAGLVQAVRLGPSVTLTLES